jgi:hypothetical protein
MNVLYFKQKFDDVLRRDGPGRRDKGKPSVRMGRKAIGPLKIVKRFSRQPGRRIKRAEIFMIAIFNSFEDGCFVV